MIAGSKRAILFILFYIAVVIMMLFMFFYVQRHYRYEASHPQTSAAPEILMHTSPTPSDTDHAILMNS